MKPDTNRLTRQESEISVLLEIVLDENYHALIPNIEALVQMSWTEVLRFSGGVFCKDNSVLHLSALLFLGLLPLPMSELAIA